MPNFNFATIESTNHRRVAKMNPTPGVKILWLKQNAIKLPLVRISYTSLKDRSQLIIVLDLVFGKNVQI